MSTRLLGAVAALAAILATTAPAPAAPGPKDPYLFTRPAHPALVTPTSTAAADLDGDGRTDLVSTVGINSVSWGISVLRGRAHGFARATFAPTGRAVTAAQAADVNGDGRPDVVASSPDAEGTYAGVVLPGLGDGTLAEPMDLPFPAYRRVEVGRYAAGQRGAVVAADGELSYWRSIAGDFGFVRDRSLVGGDFSELLAVDLDGDGRDEVAAIGDGKVHLLRDLAPAGTVSFPTAVALDAADVTGDGRPELLATGSSGDVRAFDGSLAVVRSGAAGLPGAAATAGDLNGDGAIDLVRVNQAPSLTVFWAGAGKVDVPLARPAHAAWVLDATGDGDADLVAVQQASSVVEIVEGDGAGGFSAQRPTVSTNPNGWWTRTADFNNDARPDVIVAQLNTNFVEGYLTFSTASVLLGNGNGGFTRAGEISTQGTSTGFDVGDVNGDGRADVVVTDYHSGTVSQYLGNGDGTFGQRIYLPGCPLNDAVVVGDFNGDAYADAASACRGTVFQQTLSIYLGSPAGLAPGVTLGLSHSNLPWAMRLGDLNGDGRQDILLDSNQRFKPCAPPCTLIESSYDGALTYFLGLGNGLFEPQARDYLVGRTVGDSWIADVTGDGRGDVITSIPYDDQVQIAPGKADGTLGAPFSIDVLEYPLGVRTGDLTGDGKLDLVMTHGPAMISVTPGMGDGTFGDPTAYATRTAPGHPALGRFDGDARVDLFVPEGAMGEVFLQGT